MKKQIAIIIVLILTLGAGGAWLSAYGTDAASVGTQKKNSLLATEQMNVSFQQVGGRVMEVYIQQSQFVEPGDVLMRLDTHDLDLQLQQIEIQLSMMDSQISQTQGSLTDYDINVQQYTTQKAQDDLAHVQTDYERMKTLTDHDINLQQYTYSLEKAEDDLVHVQTDYERVKTLFEAGVVPQINLDEAERKLTAAKNVLQQNQELLDKYQQKRLEEAERKLTAAAKTLNQNQELLDKYQYNRELGNINVTLLEDQKKTLEVQRQSLLDQKERMTLKAPAAGQVLTVIPKAGENVSPNAPVVVLQSSHLYFDIYVVETQVGKFQVGGTVPVYVVATGQAIPGTVRYVISAPQFTSSRMSRDNGQADISSFQIRIDLEEGAEDLLPGMTVEVRLNEAI